MDNQNIKSLLNPQAENNQQPQVPQSQTPQPVLEPSAPLQPEALQPVGPTKKSLLIGSISLAVLLIGGSALAYVFYPVNPEKVLAKMLDNLPSITSMEYTAKFDLDITGIDIPMSSESNSTDDTMAKRQIQFSLELEGKSDTKEIENSRSSAKIKLSGEGLVASGEVISVGQIIYLKLIEAPFLGFLDTGKIKDQWYKFDAEKFQNDSGVRDNSDYQLTEEKKQKILEAFKKHPIFKPAEKLKSEKIEGISTYHYRITIDKEQSLGFLKEAMEIMGQQAFEMDLEEAKKGLDSINFSNVEVWVGKKNNLPYRYSLVVNIKHPEKADVSGTLTMSITHKNYNQPVRIEAPGSAQDLNELLGPGFMPAPQSMLPMSQDFTLPHMPDYSNPD